MPTTLGRACATATLSVLVCLGAGCLRSGYDESQDAGEGRDVGSEASLHDLTLPTDSQQLPDSQPLADSQPLDGTKVDGGIMPDTIQPQLPTLSCSAPQPIPGAETFYEPAIRSDGLTLLAVDPGVGWQATTRQTLSSPWEDWSLLPQPPYLGQDLMFFQDPSSNVEQAITVREASDGKRYLELCDAAVETCQQITVIGPAGQAITDDMDGPKLAWGSPFGGTGGWQMVLNVQPGDNSTVDIWGAMPTDNSLLTWQAGPLSELNLPDVKDDDPSLTPDGRAVVFSRSTSTSAGLLYVATRNTPQDHFSTPVPLADLNSGLGDYDVVFFPLPNGQLEAYFSSYRFSSDRQIMSAVCTLE